MLVTVLLGRLKSVVLNNLIGDLGDLLGELWSCYQSCSLFSRFQKALGAWQALEVRLAPRMPRRCANLQ